jgi:hypothetical protein
VGVSQWRLTGFYGEPSGKNKYKSWEYIRQLNIEFDLPWIILGDFNEILYAHEKEGGNMRPPGMTQNFRQCLSECGLEDLGYIGDIFTWRRGEIRERLDRAVGNERWSAMFPFAAVINKEHSRSDHRPIVVDTEYHVGMCPSRRSARQFEARWLKEETVEEIVKTSWLKAKARGLYGVMECTAEVHKDLHTWDKKCSEGAETSDSQKFQKELEELRKEPISIESTVRQKELQVVIENLLDQEEIAWLQRGRANWLMHGDRNTSFFQRNHIKKLKDDSGIWKEDVTDLNNLVTNYFATLFPSEVLEPDPEVINKVHRRVTAEMNRVLLVPFTVDDVRKALFSIGDLKAPGPDGLHAIFFKIFWTMMEDELVQEVLNAVNTGVIPEGWNNTVIVMIPKVQNPESVAQFRPISLCNVVYKIISKMLAARLKLILPDIISPTQSAFVPGRLITDNVLVAYECFHAIKKRKEGKQGFCAVKLDMHKAYDRIEWSFLEKILLQMGFQQRWVKMIMSCVSTVQYRVRFNSQETEIIKPTRGLRQGDPLSPYLFLLCTEGLTSLINQAEQEGELQGVRVYRGLTCYLQMTHSCYCMLMKRMQIV